MPMALTDPNLPGNPIVFANDAFLKLSGYSMTEVLGQRPHFMNGPDTDPKDAARFAESIRADQDDIIETVQYRKNGSRFVATVLLSAFKNEEGNALNHFMSWLDVTRRVDAEDEVADLKRIEAALRESEQRADLALEAAEIGMAALEASQAELASELESAKVLQSVSSLLIEDTKPDELYERIIEAGMAIMHSQFGSLQLLRPDQGKLQLIGWRNFHPDSAAYWQEVEVVTGTSCGSALAHGERVIIPDVDECETLKGTKSLHHYRLSGIKAVQSTPLTARDGTIIGMISTHWREPRMPDERELRLFDVLVRQAADFIERTSTQEALRESERHAKTLLAELQHRVRNTLGVIRSIAKRTAKNSKSVEELLTHFQGRLEAFSRVQAAVTRNADGTVRLSSIIDDELLAHAAHSGKQVHVAGPDISLDPRTAEHLSLAVHELTTNAVKHGALVDGEGLVRISWAKKQNGAGEELVFNWSESGVEIEAGNPLIEGFGMELLCRSLPYDIGGRSSFDVTPTGLRFELRIPLSEAAL